MSEIVVTNLVKHFGSRRSVRAVDDVSFRVAAGNMLVLLGPSGCGKSTTLRCLAGLEKPDSGRVVLGDRVMYDRAEGVDVAIHRRDIGLVFQAFALWPHRTAFQNIEFPLVSKRVPRAERRDLIRRVSSLVDLTEELLQKHPGQLSGGQQQRVALARAIVGQPHVVLFDEPLSNLDALLREQLRLDLRMLHREVGFTGVYVTHDLVEALALGDEIAVMRNGMIAQIGPPEQVFEHPENHDIARLLGFRLVCSLAADGGILRSDVVRLAGSPPKLADRHSGEIACYVRPDQVTLRDPSDPTGPAMRIGGGTLREFAHIGRRTEAILELAGQRLRVEATPGSTVKWQIGSDVALDLPLDGVRFFASTGDSVPTSSPIGVDASASAGAVL